MYLYSVTLGRKGKTSRRDSLRLGTDGNSSYSTWTGRRADRSGKKKLGPDTENGKLVEALPRGESGCARPAWCEFRGSSRRIRGRHGPIRLRQVFSPLRHWRAGSSLQRARPG